MQKEMVSIIVPVYNVEKYIDKCLSSLQEQSYSNIEVIIVDDGSKDQSALKAEKFTEIDDRFRMIKKENGGVSTARNCGIDVATGEYICFVDPDDYVKKDYIKHFVEKIEDAQVVIAKSILDDRDIGRLYVPFESVKVNKFFEGQEKEWEIVDRLIFDGLSDDYLIAFTLMPLWKNMYRADFIKQEEIRFISERKVYAEDYLFNLEVYARAKKIKVIDDADYVHLNLRGTLSQMYRKNMFEMQVEKYRNAKAVLKECCQKEIVNRLDETEPYMVAYSAFKSVQCLYPEAMDNLEKILESDITKTVLNKHKSGIMPIHIKYIYFLLRHRMKRTIVISVKAMYIFKVIFGYTRMFLRK